MNLVFLVLILRPTFLLHSPTVPSISRKSSMLSAIRTVCRPHNEYCYTFNRYIIQWCAFVNKMEFVFIKFIYVLSLGRKSRLRNLK